MRMNNVFKGFGHLCLTVNDVDVSLAFYHGLLGFDILMRREKEVPGVGLLTVVSLGSSSGALELVHKHGGGNANDASATSFGWHFSIVVADIDEAIRQIQAFGLKIDAQRVDTDANWIGGQTVKSVHFRGPDGEPLELEQFLERQEPI